MKYTIGPRSLRFVCPWLPKRRAVELAAALGDAFHRHHITTLARAAAAIAQMAHESDGFRTAVEYASGAEYEGRRDLGNVRPGDGKRFKGRGFIQITGRANYSAISHALKHDFVLHPGDLEHDSWAAMASASWWEAHGCNQLADRGDFIGLTRRINGGTNGLGSRRAYYRRARVVARFLTPRREK